MIRKIALSGKANSGKSTIADILIKKLPDQEIKIFAFADPMKEIVQIIFPDVPSNVLWGPSNLRNTIIHNALEDYNDPKSLRLTCRRALLDIGKFGRKYNTYAWINATISKVNFFLDNNKNGIAIISDCRFKNELESIKKDDFFITRIVRENNLFNSTDISEIDLDDVPMTEFNHVLQNDKLSDLEGKVDQLISKLIDYPGASSDIL